jgi:hypothetical protein
MDPLKWGDEFESKGSAFHFHGAGNSSNNSGRRDLYGAPQRGIYPLSIRHQGDSASFGLTERVLCHEGMAGRSTGGNGRSGNVGARYVPDANEDSMQGDSFQWTNCLHVTAQEAKECTVFLTRTHLSVLYHTTKTPPPPKTRKHLGGERSRPRTFGAEETSRALQPIAPNLIHSPSKFAKQSARMRHFQPSKSVDRAQRDAIRRLQGLDSATKSEAIQRLREAGGILNSSISSSLSFQEDDDSESRSSSAGSSTSILRDVKALEQQLSNTEQDDRTISPSACGDFSAAFSKQEMEYIRKIKLRAQQYLEELPADEGLCCESEDHNLESMMMSEADSVQKDEKSIYEEPVELTWSLASLTEAYPRHYRMSMIGMEIFGPSVASSVDVHSHDSACGATPGNGNAKANPLHIRAERDQETGILVSPLSETSVYIAFSSDAVPSSHATLPSTENGHCHETERRRKDFMWKLKLYSPQLNLDFWHTLLDQTYSRVTMDPLRNLTDAWRRGRISNYDYLLRLNCIAGRSQHDITSYPVLPWVLSNYTSETIDLHDNTNYRDLSKPMGALDEERLQNVFMEKFRALEAMTSPLRSHSNSSRDTDDERNIPPFMYGSHYSSVGGVVLHYLVRMKPFDRLHKQLQGGSFDFADRLFDSVPRTWEKCSKVSPTEVKELTKEWYSNPSFLCNHNDFALGTSAGGKVVADIVLPPWANGSPSMFVEIMRNALESEVCSGMLHQWIDLIFGL